MQFSALLRQTPEWMQTSGPHRDIVITSRIRFARNLVDAPFPGWAKKEQRSALMAELQPQVASLPEMQDAFVEDMANLSQIEKQVLVEKHLISREQAAKSNGSAAVINKAQTISIMINEEDHLRMQSIRSGLDLQTAFAALDRVDNELSEKVPFAYDAQLGFLTACPTNLGTGMRASAMLHLPGLVLSESMAQVNSAVQKIGLAVRGLYGEGTEALANLFQISNQHTLGDSEATLIARLEKVIEQIISHERNARSKLLQEQPTKVSDHVGRAYAILRYAHILESKEALTHLSMLRLGSDLGLVPHDYGKMLDSVLVEIQPAHLQIASKKRLNSTERDILRAQMLREKLQTLPEPKLV
jgi:protein arginine kinase